MTVNYLTIMEAASLVTDVFPVGSDVESVYRKIAKLIHPDLFHTASSRERAEKAFIKLGEFYSRVKNPTVLTVGGWSVSTMVASGNISDLYLTEKGGTKGLFKIAKSSKDNDLILREKEHLKKLHGSAAKNTFNKYFPTVLDSFLASGRQVNVINYDSSVVSVDHLSKAMPDLDFKHVVWIGNRLFSSLFYLESIGLVHGAILPEHVLIRPDDHGMLLVDWCYSAVQGNPIPAMVPGRESFYPSEVKRKVVTPGTDVYMAAKTLQSLHTNVPPAFHALFEWCTAGSPSSRPTAVTIADKWKETAEKVYGPAKFISLNIPIN